VFESRIVVGQTFFSRACVEKHGDPTTWRAVELVGVNASPHGMEIVEEWEDARGTVFDVVYLIATPDPPAVASCRDCDPATTLDEASAVPDDCQRCGTCCTSQSRDYVTVKASDLKRMSDVAKALVAPGESVRFMRMLRTEASAHCAALTVDPDAGTFRCSIYEERPDACRDFTQGSDKCREHLVGKRRLPMFALDALRAGGR